MYSVGLYLFAFAGYVLADTLVFEKCSPILKRELFKCCKDPMPALKQDKEELMMECKDIPYSPSSCDHEKCIAKKLGLMASDETLDTGAFLNMLDQDSTTPEEHKTAVKENCVGHLDTFGPPSICDFKKLKACSITQSLFHCSDWSSDSPCDGAKDVVSECKTALSA